MSSRPAVRALLLACLPASVACSIPLEAMDSSPTNACDRSVECGPGATCADVSGQRACVSTSARLEGLILEIRPRASREVGAEVSHLLDIDAGSSFPPDDPGGQVRSLDLGIPPPAHVEVTLRLGGSYCGGLTGGQFPVKAEFRRIAPVLGLPTQSYSTLSEPLSEPNGPDGQRIQLAIPAGSYHLYLIPQAHSGCRDDLPPPIFLPTKLQRVPERWTVGITAEAPAVLQGSLQVPAGMRVDGWKLDLVDRLTGSVISQVGILEHGEAAPAGTASRVEFSVKYYWTDTEDTEKKEVPLIRLRPKDGEPRPTVYWDLESVALHGSTENLTLSLLQLDAAARRVEGRTLDASDNPVLSAVRIQSTNIDRATTAASYKLDTETDASGLFRVDLPPGEYVVFAQPINDTTKARARQSLRFAAGDDCYCGQSVLIPEAGTLRGRVQGPTGELMDGASVFAAPSLGEVTTYVNQVQTPEPLLPRQASGVLRNGAFSIGADPGEFDFSVRPTPGSAYPWLVRPRLVVPATDAAVTDLELAMSYPAVLQGVVRDASGAPLGDAAVVAWLPVESKTAQGTVTGVIQIGETRSAPDGSYVLPLPPSTSR